MESATAASFRSGECLRGQTRHSDLFRMHPPPNLRLTLRPSSSSSSHFFPVLIHDSLGTQLCSSDRWYFFGCQIFLFPFIDWHSSPLCAAIGFVPESTLAFIDLFSARLYHLAAEYCHRATAQSSAPHCAPASNGRRRLGCRVSAVSRPGRSTCQAAVVRSIWRPFVDAMSTCYRPSPGLEHWTRRFGCRWIVLSDGRSHQTPSLTCVRRPAEREMRRDAHSAAIGAPVKSRAFA